MRHLAEYRIAPVWGSRNAVVEEHCIVAAGAVVLENTICESGHIYAGVPAKKVKALSQDQIAGMAKTADNYVMYASWFQDGTEGAESTGAGLRSSARLHRVVDRERKASYLTAIAGCS